MENNEVRAPKNEENTEQPELECVHTRKNVPCSLNKIWNPFPHHLNNVKVRWNHRLQISD